MKQSLLILLFILISGIIYPQNNREQKTNVMEYCARDDEYQSIHYDNDDINTQNDNPIVMFSEDQEDTLEYEQIICDSVTPPKPSYITSFFTHIGCSVLVHYIALTEKAKIMLSALKHTIAKWLCAHA